jgi:hypothetical protein
MCPACGMGDLQGFAPTDIDKERQTTTYYAKCNNYRCGSRYRVAVHDNGEKRFEAI